MNSTNSQEPDEVPLKDIPCSRHPNMGTFNLKRELLRALFWAIFAAATTAVVFFWPY